MASKVDASEQVKFLVSCIAHTNNGKPDFQLVADELHIVTKAAAQKRYERMLKAHNVTKKPANSDGASDAAKTPRKKRAAPGADAAEGEETPVKKTPVKRRKAVKKEEGSEEEEEAKPAATPKPKTPRKAKAVKKEDSKDEPKENASATSKEDEDKAQESPLSDAPASGEDSAGDF